MPVTALLDEKNTSLWQYLNERHRINIRRENRADYLASNSSEEMVIYVPKDRPDSACFTHELLHIYFWVDGIDTENSLQLLIEKKEALTKFCSRHLLERVANSLEHLKMYPVFLRMGYRAERFYADYHTCQLTGEDLQVIREHYRRRFFFENYYHSYGIGRFIEKYFAARACPNPGFDYSKQLQELKRISPSLYGVLDRFTENWTGFDMKLAQQPVANSYRLIVADFVTELEHWARGKTII